MTMSRVSPAMVLLTLGLFGWMSSTDAAARRAGGRDENGRASGELRAREGTKITEKLGKFQLSGDRVLFTADEETEPYRLLENLALERVANSLNEARAERKWSVSGTVTEYRGSNYLLLSRALIVEQEKAATDAGRAE